MKKLSHLMLTELLKLRDEYESPATLREDAIKRGIEAELEEREGKIAKEIQSLEEENSELRQDLENAESEASNAKDEREALEEEMNKLELKISALEGEIRDLKAA